MSHEPTTCSSQPEALSAQKLEDFAGALDHLLLERRGIEKFQAVVEAHAIADDTTHDEFGGVIGNQELEHQARPRFQFPGQEQAHTAAADVGSLSAKIQALTVEEHSHTYGNHDRVAFPTSIILRRIHLGFWLHRWHVDIQCLAPCPFGQSHDGNEVVTSGW